MPKTYMSIYKSVQFNILFGLKYLQQYIIIYHTLPNVNSGYQSIWHFEPAAAPTFTLIMGKKSLYLKILMKKLLTI